LAEIEAGISPPPNNNTMKILFASSLTSAKPTLESNKVEETSVASNMSKETKGNTFNPVLRVGLQQ